MPLKDFLFPKRCLNCGFLGSYICLKCEKELCYANKDICLYCGKSSYLGFTHYSCCRSKGADGFISIYYYNNTLKNIIKNIKYRLVCDAFSELFRITNYEILADKLRYFKNLKENVLICPVPLHAKRLNKRGFNQAEIIAKFFSMFLSIYVVGLLERKKNTKTQAKLTKDRERYFNIKGAFAINLKYKIKDKKIILVDDLVTSGSTVKEAASVLKQNGASQVYVLALAKG